jgi:dihydropteroate synthase
VFAGDFERHGVGAIGKVRAEKRDVYLRIAADLLPKEATRDVIVDVVHDVSNMLEAFRVMKACSADGMWRFEATCAEAR